MSLNKGKRNDYEDDDDDDDDNEVVKTTLTEVQVYCSCLHLGENR